MTSRSSRFVVGFEVEEAPLQSKTGQRPSLRSLLRRVSSPKQARRLLVESKRLGGFEGECLSGGV
jgi:hypothetical protein